MVQRGTLLNKNKEVKNLFLGGVSGCISRTIVAPMDKIKILMQHKKTTLPFTAFLKNNVKQEGFLNLWKGNGANLLRIFPFSGLQFVTYDFCKENLFENNNTNTNRLICGGISGIVATSVTHPVDVIKHRLMCYQNINTFKDATIDIYKENGGKMRNYFKGYGSTISSLTPFIALNFATFDFLKDNFVKNNENKTSTTLMLGGFSALFSQTLCYPLDTIRRRMQNKEIVYKNGLDAGKKILKHEGFLSFYKGLLPNILRMVPNTAIRFAIFDYLKRQF
tara:strand:+ start:813 stop:1646 length:834 start_codon:yes stop_codon:yes gene_type:complete